MYKGSLSMFFWAQTMDDPTGNYPDCVCTALRVCTHERSKTLIDNHRGMVSCCIHSTTSHCIIHQCLSAREGSLQGFYTPNSSSRRGQLSSQSELRGSSSYPFEVRDMDMSHWHDVRGMCTLWSMCPTCILTTTLPYHVHKTDSFSMVL